MNEKCRTYRDSDPIVLFSSPPFQCEQELVPYYFPERTKQKMRMSMWVCNSDRKGVSDLNSNMWNRWSRCRTRYLESNLSQYRCVFYCPLKQKTVPLYLSDRRVPWNFVLEDDQWNREYTSFRWYGCTSSFQSHRSTSTDDHSYETNTRHDHDRSHRRAIL